jgi:hypothetical protein
MNGDNTNNKAAQSRDWGLGKSDAQFKQVSRSRSTCFQYKSFASFNLRGSGSIPYAWKRQKVDHLCQSGNPKLNPVQAML